MHLSNRGLRAIRCDLRFKALWRQRVSPRRPVVQGLSASIGAYLQAMCLGGYAESRIQDELIVGLLDGAHSLHCRSDLA